jgi:galactokinase
MIFSPGRINFIGEHTDYNDGFVFPADIDKDIVAGIQKSNANTPMAYATDKDKTIEFFIDKLKPLAQGSWQNYILGVVTKIQIRSKTLGNFNIAFGGDFPGAAGISSSAALENSVVFRLNDFIYLGLTTHKIILISQKVEHNYFGVKCGIMDQYASMFSIDNHALLLDCRTV